MSMYMKIPMELYPNFTRDPENFMRDIACMPQDALRPFFRRRHLLSASIEGKRLNPFDEVNMSFHPSFTCTDKFRRYMHLDLGINKDAVGISMCHAPKFLTTKKSIVKGGREVKEDVSSPFIVFDFFGRITASKGEEIILSEIRELIYMLARRHFWLSLITFDRFNSVDSIQILRDAGFVAANLSIDRTAHKIRLDRDSKDGYKKISTEGQYTAPMEALKAAFYDKRISIPITDLDIKPQEEWWVKEARAAELNVKKNKVDHPPGGSIDVLQSMAGSCYNLVNNEFEFIDVEGGEDESLKDPFYDLLSESTFDSDRAPDIFDDFEKRLR